MLQLFYMRKLNAYLTVSYAFYFDFFSFTRSCWYFKMRFRFQLKWKKKFLIYPICLFLLVIFIGLYTESSSFNDKSTYTAKRWVELQCLLYILIIYFSVRLSCGFAAFAAYSKPVRLSPVYSGGAKGACAPRGSQYDNNTSQSASFRLIFI